VRVSAERVFELARHLTERDREIALALYQHQLLTTDQLTLLFFSSKRRAQDRLRFLYDQRVLDRFYPPRPHGLGKPQAHWLLDEAGAILVAASLELERKELNWRRRDDWSSYPQLLHRLEANGFVTDLIAATLPDESLGVSEWWSSRVAAARLSDPGGSSRPIPDTGFYLETPAGPIECYLEWDRSTETLARLSEKVETVSTCRGARADGARLRERALRRSHRTETACACRGARGRSGSPPQGQCRLVQAQVVIRRCVEPAGRGTRAAGCRVAVAR